MATSSHVENVEVARKAATAAAAKPTSLGNLVRLTPLSLHDLPYHPAFADLLTDDSADKRRNDSNSTNGSAQQKPTRPSLRDFIAAALTEANTFVDNVPTSFHSVSTTKKSKPAAAPVELLERTITSYELGKVPWDTSSIKRNIDKAELEKEKKKGEAWFARRSRHANISEPGSANWAEFDSGLRVEHSKHEEMYTDGVYDSYRVLDWDDETRGTTWDEGWQNVDMRIFEMAHHITFPIRNRVFPVLIITASGPSPQNPSIPSSFLVVQLPIDLRPLPQAFYSRGRNLTETKHAIKKKKVVMGVYASIEKCVLRPDLNIEWTMATASDAKGALPMWMQKLGVPAQIVADVGLFINWVGKRRQKSPELMSGDLEARTGVVNVPRPLWES